ncbi:DUF5829 family protein [Maribacter flavus]|uniref:Uncharacterized protein n=1 Tax=Maribacter flavus TaxID=1658664 RepID=A0A5B2TVX8_9FLAO|nr:DUF5829 family protein [Maribacter flavus]KAA2218677.1 hypothetical protein F0361_03370 [Maribacter flavus]
MIFRKLFLLIAIISMISCKKQGAKLKNDLVDREKIDKLFKKDVSQIYFDHLYVVLDSLSYSEFTNSPSWFKNYAKVDLGLPNFEPIDEKATSCYLRGHRHYIEILGPNNDYNEPVGKSGIGFSLENDGGHFHLGVKPKLKKDSNSFLRACDTVSMPIGKSKSVWFKAFYTPSRNTSLHTWYAFYNPIFLDSLFKKKHKTYTREAYLQNAYDHKRLFKGIKAIEMDCTPKDYNRIAQEMRHLGCDLIKKEADKLTIASGDILITIEPSTSVAFSRITKLRCHLNEPDNSITRFGNLAITNEGTESVWHFETPASNKLK